MQYYISSSLLHSMAILSDAICCEWLMQSIPINLFQHSLQSLIFSIYLLWIWKMWKESNKTLGVVSTLKIYSYSDMFQWPYASILIQNPITSLLSSFILHIVMLPSTQPWSTSSVIIWNSFTEKHILNTQILQQC